MSTKADFSAEEWKLVLRSPLMAGLAVVAASPSGPLGVLREMFAVGKLVHETRAQADATGGLTNDLLRSLAELSSPDARSLCSKTASAAHRIVECRTTACTPTGVL